ncbi:MAG TPA: M48 family metallopeptidase [Verrucomicrobiae bacterium]|nr:M48 family metallopeptidase [Verrucomicrobiae bacterium]
MRALGFAAFAATFALAGSAWAANPLPFDPELATHAWLATMGDEATAQSNAYFEGGYLIDFANIALSILVAGVLLLLGWARDVRAWLEKTVKWFPLVALGMALFVMLWSTVITFPFNYYSEFVREHQYGLLSQTFSEWFTDQLKGAGVGLAIGSVFIAIIYCIIRVAKNTWWIWGSAVSLVFAVIMSMLYPVFIAPMFNESRPMEQSALRDEIVAMAQANGVPAEDVYVYDRSRQTSTISANVSGFGETTRISLADTLLERASPEAVRAVMAHEIGHYVLRHNISGLIFSSIIIVITFAVAHFGFLAVAKGERWGVRDISDPAGLPLLLVLLSVIGLFTAPIQRNFIYFNEQQADMFGLNVAREPDGFAEASVLLSEYRKMEPSALEEWFFYDHPSGWNRVHNSMVWKAHEIAAGRLAPSPGGPPEGWVPDFVREREAAAAATSTP